MKKILGAFLGLTAFFLGGCASDGVSRIDSSTVTDYSGYWNDTDVKIVAESLINECMESPAINNFPAKNKRIPVVIVGRFRNQSDEHIDTSIITKKMEVALINSGKVDFVASSGEREQVREERDNQAVFANELTQKNINNETAADFMLMGSVKTITDGAGNKMTKTYYVSAELVDMETNRKIWAGENSSIKKLIKKSSARY